MKRKTHANEPRSLLVFYLLLNLFCKRRTLVSNDRQSSYWASQGMRSSSPFPHWTMSTSAAGVYSTWAGRRMSSCSWKKAQDGSGSILPMDANSPISWTTLIIIHQTAFINYQRCKWLQHRGWSICPLKRLVSNAHGRLNGQNGSVIKIYIWTLSMVTWRMGTWTRWQRMIETWESHLGKPMTSGLQAE